MTTMMTHLTFIYSRCQIDFVQNPTTTSVDQNIIFHISVRPSENAIIRNHYEFGRWGHEERYGQFRIRKHEAFEIYVLAEHEYYKVAVNGHHIGVFRHRLPLNLVNFVRVSGEVQVDHILLEQDMHQPQIQSQGQIVVTQITQTQQRPMDYSQGSIATNITAIPSAPPARTPIPMNVHVLQSHPPPLYQPTTVSKIINSIHFHITYFYSRQSQKLVEFLLRNRTVQLRSKKRTKISSNSKTIQI
jgi:hypothetical protein